MSPVTINALEAFPAQLEAHYAAVPPAFRHWAPASWLGIPSEPLTAIEQLCHVRDVEIDGYHRRFQRTLDEANPFLPALDAEGLARERSYGTADAASAFVAFRAARHRTIELVTGCTGAQLQRSAEFEGYGRVTVLGLVHYLCSHDQQHLAGLQWLLGQIESAHSQGHR